MVLQRVLSATCDPTMRNQTCLARCSFSKSVRAQASSEPNCGQNPRASVGQMVEPQPHARVDVPGLHFVLHITLRVYPSQCTSDIP